MANDQKYINAYNAKNYTQIQIRFRNDNAVDTMLLGYVKQHGNIQQYIKMLILQDINEHEDDTKQIV